MNNAPWDKNQIKSFVKQVRNRLGLAWDFMVPEVREAMIKAQALSIIRAQAAESVAIEKIDFLVNAMLNEAGL